MKRSGSNSWARDMMMMRSMLSMTRGMNRTGRAPVGRVTMHVEDRIRDTEDIFSQLCGYFLVLECTCPVFGGM